MGVGQVTPEKARDMLAAAGADGFTAPEMCITPELIDHAPIMAEQIANMHYEYAVQGQFTKKLEWGSLHDAEKELAEVRSAWWSSGSYRIVRRLVSVPEVVE